VLLVDDDPHIRQVMSRVLLAEHISLRTAATAEEALQFASVELFDSILTDLNMPGMGGEALIKRLEALQPQAHCFVLTGDASWHPARGESAYVRGVLHKPWSSALLLDLLRDEAEPASRVVSHASRLPPRDLPSIMLVESNLEDVVLFRAALEETLGGEVPIRHARTVAEAIRMTSAHAPDVVCAGLDLPDAQGLNALARLLAVAPEIPLIVIAEAADSLLATRSLQAGAQDFIVKRGASGSGIWKAIQDAIQRKSVERRLLALAFQDPLTGVANRTMFRQRLAQSLARNRRDRKPFSVLLLDMDHFKSINDSLGHDAGDMFLQEVARRLSATVREYDTVARFGGDEFAVLLDQLESPGEALAVATRILVALAQPYGISEIEVVSTASIGVASYPEVGETIEELIKAADTAMYRAKHMGRNTLATFDENMSRSVAARFKMEMNLRQALGRDEFSLEFQPQVEIRTGKTFALEALLRWHPHGTTGSQLVPPVEFIPVLEESGMILPVGNWVLDSACEQFAGLKHRGVALRRVAVNVSAKQIERGNLVERVRSVLQRTGLKPCELELELTETALLSGSTHTHSVLRELVDIGVRLSLDDFGTGYSSLAYVHDFPVSTLKIDRSFTSALGQSVKQSAVVAAILELAKRLDLEVVAEGVETHQQLDWLRAEGCPAAQGFLFAMPCRLEQLALALAS
jgi:diguanylate cyclase (GGDEF)-like protein